MTSWCMAHPWMTFFIALSAIEGIQFVVNRSLRHRNIIKHGYPPPYCDADGDFREDDK